MVTLLLQSHADIDKGKSDDGTTATFIAAQDGQDGIVEILAAAGADVNIPTDDGSTPLFMVRVAVPAVLFCAVPRRSECCCTAALLHRVHRVRTLSGACFQLLW